MRARSFQSIHTRTVTVIAAVRKLNRNVTYCRMPDDGRERAEKPRKIQAGY